MKEQQGRRKSESVVMRSRRLRLQEQVEGPTLTSTPRMEDLHNLSARDFAGAIASPDLHWPSSASSTDPTVPCRSLFHAALCPTCLNAAYTDNWLNATSAHRLVIYSRLSKGPYSRRVILASQARTPHFTPLNVACRVHLAQRCLCYQLNVQFANSTKIVWMLQRAHGYLCNRSGDSGLDFRRNLVRHFTCSIGFASLPIKTN